MQVYTLPTNLNPAYFLPTAGLERAVAAQQIVEVRRKRQAGANLDEDSRSLDSFVSGDSPEGGSRQPKRKSQGEPQSSWRLQDTVEDQANEHISFWA